MAHNLSRHPITVLPALVAGLLTIQFTDVPTGLIHGIELDIAGTLTATSGSPTAFNSSNPRGDATLARNGDDVDKVMAALFDTTSGFSLNVDGTTPGKYFQGVDHTIIRSALGFMLAFDSARGSGGLTDGTSIATGGTAFKVQLYIPLARPRRTMKDGDQFAIGSSRLVKGSFGAKLVSATPSVTMVNGTASVSALAWTGNYVYDSLGSSTAVGPGYYIEDLPGLQAAGPVLEPAAREYLLDDGSTYTGTYTISKASVEAVNTPAASFGDDWNRQWRAPGEAHNPCARAIPLVAPQEGLGLAEYNLNAYAPNVKNDGNNTQHLISVRFVAKPDAALGAMHTRVTGSGGVSTLVDSVPASLAGSAAPARLSRWVQTSVLAGTHAIPGARLAKNAAQAKAA